MPLRIGDKAPEPECQDVNGKAVTWDTFGQRAIVLFFHSETMAYSEQGLRDVLDAIAADETLVREVALVVVSNGKRTMGDLQKAIDATGAAGRLFADPDRKCFPRYHVVAFPTVFCISKDRTVAAIAKGYGPLLTPKVLGGARLAAGLIDRQQYEKTLTAAPVQERSAEMLRLSRTVRMVRQLVAAGMYEQARDSLLRVVDKDTKNVEAIALLGRIYLRMGQKEEARSWIDRLAALSPSSIDVRLLRAHLALLENRPDETLELLEGVGETGVEVALLRGGALEQKGDFRGAAAVYRRALESAVQK